MTKLEMTS